MESREQKYFLLDLRTNVAALSESKTQEPPSGQMMEEADENGCQHFRSEKALRAKQVKDRPWVFTEPPWLHSLGREVARHDTIVHEALSSRV